jgi:hypothetical protein
MRTSCEDCGNSVVKGDHGNKDIITNGNDNLTCESENLNPSGGCEENNVKESSHRKEVLNAGRDFHNDDPWSPFTTLFPQSSQDVRIFVTSLSLF